GFGARQPMHPIGGKAAGPGSGTGKDSLVAIAIHHHRLAELSEVAETGNAIAGLARSGECRQQDRDQERDDADDDEELNESEGAATTPQAPRSASAPRRVAVQTIHSDS